MAINPYQPPTNYGGFIDLNPAFQGLGQSIQGYGELLAAQKKEQQAAAMKQQFSTDLNAAATDGTQGAINTLILKYPQFHSAFGDVRKNIGEERVKNEFFGGFEISNALENNAPDVAKARLDQIIKAKKSSGEPVGIYQQAYDAIEAGNVKGAQSMVNLGLAILDPKRYEESVKASLSQRAQTASVTTDESKAAQEGVKAKYAEPMAMADLAKIKAETLAPAIRESIDFQNLNPSQQQTFKDLQLLKKPPAAVTNVKIDNVDKSAAAELGKLVPDLYNQANSAASQITELPRYQAALENAITGPLAGQRLNVARIAGALGFSGEKGVNATRELMQGLSEMALKSRSLLTGQGQITEGEQKLLLQARSGDISFTKGELKTLLDVSKRGAEAQYTQSRKLLESASKQSPTAALFLQNIQPMAAQQPIQPAQQSNQVGMPAGFRIIQ